ncbi:hypothetical protein [Pseudomonas sp. RL_5y_Pfl2_73]|uniref:hypothetical protein n=1 Tax=Pseudomonas sp. RL_5y_Pfl2_73 TaxID=3088713 RepID=UPI0030DBF4D8
MPYGESGAIAWLLKIGQQTRVTWCPAQQGAGVTASRPVEVAVYGDAMADMFCAYLESLQRRPLATTLS